MLKYSLDYVPAIFVGYGISYNLGCSYVASQLYATHIIVILLNMELSIFVSILSLLSYYN